MSMSGGTMNDERTTRYIRAIEQARSISAAASDLGISQPALSAFLKKAEERLGTPIFDRAASPIALTAAGAALLDYQDKASQLKRDLERTVSDIENLRCGKLVVGGAAAFNATFLPQALARFAARYPDIELHVVDGTVPRITRAALEGKIDVFIAPELPDSSDLNCTPLLEERVLLCLPGDWPENELLPSPTAQGFARITRKDFALLEDRPFIALDEQQQLGKILRHLFDACDMHPKRIVHAEQTVTSLALTLNGIGASLATEGLVKQGNLKQVPALYLPDDPACTRTLFAVTPTNRTPSKAAAEFIRMSQADVGLSDSR